MLHQLQEIKVRNSRVAKSRHETELRKKTSHFELLTNSSFKLLTRPRKILNQTSGF